MMHSDRARLEWVLPILTTDDNDLADRRNDLLCDQFQLGLNGTDAIDAAMDAEVKE